jgi:acetyl-CoA synthetase
MEKLFYPNREDAKKAKIKNICEYNNLVAEAEEDYEGYWGRLAKEKVELLKELNKIIVREIGPITKCDDDAKVRVCRFIWI